MKQQDEFYKKIGVLEYIDRIGQKPISIKSSWMIDISEMKHFGICNVYADSDYGKVDYLNNWYKKFNVKMSIKSIKLNNSIIEMLNNEISNIDYKINACE